MHLNVFERTDSKFDTRDYGNMNCDHPCPLRILPLNACIEVEIQSNRLSKETEKLLFWEIIF